MEGAIIIVAIVIFATAIFFGPEYLEHRERMARIKYGKDKQ